MTTSQIVAPAGLKDVVVADTATGGVRGAEGFYHFRQYSAVELARTRSFEDVCHLMLEGTLPTPEQSAALQDRLV
jgi:citrate synthase